MISVFPEMGLDEKFVTPDCFSSRPAWRILWFRYTFVPAAATKAAPTTDPRMIPTKTPGLLIVLFGVPRDGSEEIDNSFVERRLKKEA